MKNDFRAILALITTYTIGNFLLLLSRGIYWDDWAIIPLLEEKNYALLWYLLSQGKLFSIYFLYKMAWLTNNPIFFMKFLSFISWLLAGLFLYGILRQKLALRQNRAFFISACFMLIPIYLVKIIQIVLRYSISNAIFFLAIFLYFTAQKSAGKFIKYSGYLLAWILFFLSFETNSFLVFYLGFLGMLLLLYRQENLGRPFLSLLYDFSKKHFFFIILPLIFGLLKVTIGQPTDGYEGYNQIILPNNLLTYIQNIWQNIVYGFFWPILAPLGILPRKIFSGILIIIVGLFYFLTKNILSNEKEGADFQPKQYLTAGLFLFILGVIPYFLVDKIPHIFGHGFAMRHALLLPLGSSLIILGAVIAVIKDRWQTMVQVILLSSFSTFTIFNYYTQDMDWYKQKAIIESLKETKNETIINATSLIFYDKMGANWQNRNVRGEEYFGYIQSAFPKEKFKFAAREEHDPVKNYYSNPDNIKFFSPGFNPAKKVVKVEIVSRAKREITTVKNWLKIKKSEVLRNEPEMLKDIKDIYRVEIIPFD